MVPQRGLPVRGRSKSRGWSSQALLVPNYVARTWSACWLWLRTAKSTGNRRMRPARPRNRGLWMFAIELRDPCRAIQIADCTDSGADCLPDPVQIVGPVDLGDGHHHALSMDLMSTTALLSF